MVPAVTVLWCSGGTDQTPTLCLPLDIRRPGNPSLQPGELADITLRPKTN
jgi:hypothetical protein